MQDLTFLDESYKNYLLSIGRNVKDLKQRRLFDYEKLIHDIKLIIHAVQKEKRLDSLQGYSLIYLIFKGCYIKGDIDIDRLREELVEYLINIGANVQKAYNQLFPPDCNISAMHSVIREDYRYTYIDRVLKEHGAKFAFNDITGHFL